MAAYRLHTAEPMQLNRRHIVQLPLIPLAQTLGRWANAQTPGERTVQDQTWRDDSRQRDIPVRIRWPALAAPNGSGSDVPVVMFSHGLGGTRDGGSVWGEAWVQAGFVVVHLQHPGSDFEAIHSSASSFTDPAALRRLGGAAQLALRLKDVGFVLDEMVRRKSAHQDHWAAVRTEQVGLSGHSFGAHTTLGMAGQRYPGFEGVSESRLAAFIAFSPSLPATGAARAFERITRPMLCVTGTRDGDVAGTGATPQQRMGVFAALPAGNKSQLVLADADHMTCAGQAGRAVEIIPRESVTRQLQASHHAAVVALTTDWWRAYLLGDSAAGQRLMHPVGLATGDTWQTS